ncbi:MAG TPA: phosphatase PAP2 family protein [Herpetosiphonaceae bacterium]
MIEADQRNPQSTASAGTASPGTIDRSTTADPTLTMGETQRRRGLARWLYPEELLAIALLLVTVGINISIHRTLNTEILYQNVSTYRTLFQGQIEYFLRALRYCVIGFMVWHGLRWMLGRPLHLLAWRRPDTLILAARAMLVYFFCAVAFGNLQGFIRRLSPIDRDDWLIVIDRVIFLGYEPLKLLEPLVTPWRVNFMMQIYISMMIMPFVTMVVFLHQGKLRAFRNTIVSLVLGLIVSYPGYLIMPAIGPQYTLRHLFVRRVFDVEAMLSHGIDRLTRDTFPSVHTAVSVICMILVWRYSTSRIYRIAFAVWALSIVFSTMYLRFHYVFDVIVGVLVSIFVTWLGPRFNDWYLGRAEPDAQPTA